MLISGQSVWPSGSGEMAGLVRAHDWASTPLGPLEGWSERLKATVEMVLASPLVSSVALTLERLLIYNDAAAKLYGARHPGALGQPLCETFPDSYPVVEALYDRVFAGESVTVREQPLAVRTETGAPEIFDAYLTPVREADGSVFGAHMTGLEIGSRVRTEKSLRESEELRNVALAGGRMGTWRWNLEQRVVSGDAQFLAFWGLPPSEDPIPLASFTERMSPEGAAEMEMIVTRAIEKEEEFDGPLEIVAGPTAGRWIRWRGRAAVNDKSVLYGVTFDITEQRQAESLLRESEERYRTLFERMQEGFAVLERIGLGDGETRDFRYVQTNPAWSRHTGYPRSEGRTVLQLTPGMDSFIFDKFDEALRTGESQLFETQITTRDLWVKAEAFPAGPPHHVAVIFSNINERKRAEQELRHSEARLAAAFETVPVGLSVVSLDGSSVLSNTEFRRFLPSGVIPSRDPANQRHWQAWDAHGAILRPENYPGARAMRGERVVPGQEMLYTNDEGREVWTTVSTVPICDESGKVTSQVCVIRDIDEQKRMTDRLRQSEERQIFLLKLSDALRPLANPIDIQLEAMRQLGMHLGVSRAQYYEAEAGGEHVVTHGGYASDLPAFVGRLRMDDFGPHVKKALDEGRTLVVPDARVDPRLTPAEIAAHEAIGVRAYLGASLAKNGRLVTICGIHDSKPHNWTPLEIALVNDTAERTWAAVERARAEAALRESEEKYHNLFERMEEGFGICELVRDEAGQAVDWRYLDLNPAFTKYSGMDRKDVIGPLFSELFPGSDRSYWIEMYQDVVDHQIYRRFESYWPPVGRWYAGSASPAGGQRFNVVYEDVSERKKAEIALKESEKRQAFLLKLSDTLRPLADSAEIQSATTRLLGEHLNLDRCYYFEPDHQTGEYIIYRDFKRGSLRSLVGRHPMQQWPEMTAALSRGEMLVIDDYADSAKIPAAERPPTANLDIGAIIIVPLVKNGSLVACMSAIQSTPRKWDGGEVSLTADVAERTWAAVERARAETALQASEQRFRLFVENVREYALVQTDFEGVITSWNPGAERLSGYSSDEVLGKPFVLLLPEKDRHEGIIAREMANISRGERNIDAHTMQRKDGSLFWAEWITEPVLDDKGDLRGTAKVIRDETERQKTTLFVRNSLAEKEELLREVHHRVKNNLQVITSVLNLQAASLEDERVLAVFQEMRNRVQSIASIHELLYRSTYLASIPLVSYAKQLLSGLIQSYGSQNRVEGQVVGSEDATIELERAVPFGLVLNELISNALKHGFPGKATGKLWVEIETADSDTVLRVSNTGKGLPVGLDIARSSTLGLRLVEILARQLRGTFRVLESPEASFEIRFPAIDRPIM